MTVSLEWDANMETDLEGYKMYTGTSSRNYSNVIDLGNVTSAYIEIGTGTFFAVTAYNTAGLESGFSNEVFYEP